MRSIEVSLAVTLLLATAATALVPFSLYGVGGVPAPACNSPNAFVPQLGDGLLTHIAFDGLDASGNVTSSMAGPLNNLTLSPSQPPGDSSYTRLPLGFLPGKVGMAVNFAANITRPDGVFKNFLIGKYPNAMRFASSAGSPAGPMSSFSAGVAANISVAFWVKVMSFEASPYAGGQIPMAASLFTTFGFDTSYNVGAPPGISVVYGIVSPGPPTLSIFVSTRCPPAPSPNGGLRISASDPFADIQPGLWAHVVFVATGSTLELFINGSRVTTSAFVNSPCPIGAAYLLDGADSTAVPGAYIHFGNLMDKNAQMSGSAVFGSPLYYEAVRMRIAYNITLDEFAIWTRTLTDADVATLYAAGMSGQSLSSGAVSAKATCVCGPAQYVVTPLQCGDCHPLCKTCTGPALAQCTECRAGLLPECCAPATQCANCTGASDNCLACARGFANAPTCTKICSPSCLQDNCPNGGVPPCCPPGEPDLCTVCAAGYASVASTGRCVRESGLSKAKSNNLPAIAGGGVVGLVALVAIVVIIVICCRRRKGEKPLDYAALMGKPVDADAWERLFPDWMTARYTLPASKAYPVMDEFVRATPLDPRLCAGLAESAPKRGLSDLVVATMAYSEAQADLSMVLLKQLIDLEVSATLSAETLFRTNSAATKFFQSLAKLRAVEYVRKTIGPLVHDTLHQFHKTAAKAEAKAGAAADPEGAGVYMSVATDGMEIDPTRLDEGGSADINKYKLMTVCAAFLDTIFRSAASCPQALKEILAYVGQAVARAYPGKEVQGMGGFFFLRLFCPAITSPSEYLITQGQTGDEERRYLVLIAKVLQNAANGVKFGKKEAHMVELNEFIDSSIPKITRFFSEQLFAGANPIMNTYPGPNPPPPPVPAMVRANALCVIHENVRESAPALAEWLNSHQAGPVQPQLDAMMVLPPPPAAIAAATR